MKHKVCAFIDINDIKDFDYTNSLKQMLKSLSYSPNCEIEANTFSKCESVVLGNCENIRECFTDYSDKNNMDVSELERWITNNPVTLLPSAIDKFADKYHLTPEEVREELAQLSNSDIKDELLTEFNVFNLGLTLIKESGTYLCKNRTAEDVINFINKSSKNHKLYLLEVETEI